MNKFYISNMLRVSYFLIIKSDGPRDLTKAADSRVRDGRHIVIGRLAYFVLSYSYVYPTRNSYCNIGFLIK